MTRVFVTDRRQVTHPFLSQRSHEETEIYFLCMGTL